MTNTNKRHTLVKTGKPVTWNSVGRALNPVKRTGYNVKGVVMSVYEYRSFVAYLNNYRVQTFTKKDVLEFLRNR